MKASDGKNARTGIGLALVLGAITSFAAAPMAVAQRPLGLDVSYWQGNLSQANWNSVHANGWDFVSVRATHYSAPGETDAHGSPDPYFVQNVTRARTAGMLSGAYSFVRNTIRDPITEADFFLTYAAPYITAGYLRPMLDLEDGTAVVGATNLSAWTNAWLDRVQQRTGVEPTIYCNSNYAKNYLNSTVASRTLWLANWGQLNGDPQTMNPPAGATGVFSPTWVFWQYSNQGNGTGVPVPGISARVDLDVFNGTYDELRGYVIGTGITDVQATSMTGNVATITWKTDANTSSRVKYGTTTSYGSLTPLDSNNVTSHSVSLSSLTPGTLYHYRVISANPNWPTATTSSDFTFTTATCSLTITQHPQPQNPCAAGTATFNVAATGVGALTYQWQKYNGSTWDDVSNDSRFSGATTAALTIASVAAGDAANYRCMVTASCGSVPSNPALLSLKAATTITQPPSPQNLCPGGTATFYVGAAGSGSTTYRWQKYNGSTWDNVSNDGRVSGATAAMMTIASVAAGDARDYRCMVTAGCGSVTSNPAALSVRAATTVTQQPQPQTVNARDTATFTAAATGDGAVTYQWQHYNGTTWDNVNNDDRISGAATATLTVLRVVKNDAGDYRCMATAGCGSATSSAARLTVNVPLFIATDVDGDGDVDLNDFGFFRMCFSGPNGVHLYLECEAADFDGDTDVDLSDFALFRGCFNGVNRPPACQ